MLCSDFFLNSEEISGHHLHFPLYFKYSIIIGVDHWASLPTGNSSSEGFTFFLGHKSLSQTLLTLGVTQVFSLIFTVIWALYPVALFSPYQHRIMLIEGTLAFSELPQVTSVLYFNFPFKFSLQLKETVSVWPTMMSLS